MRRLPLLSEGNTGKTPALLTQGCPWRASLTFPTCPAGGGPAWAPSYLQDEGEVVRRLAALVQVMVCGQAVALIKPHFLVDTGVPQQVQQDLLRHSQWAEHIHL